MHNEAGSGRKFTIWSKLLTPVQIKSVPDNPSHLAIKNPIIENELAFMHNHSSFLTLIGPALCENQCIIPKKAQLRKAFPGRHTQGYIDNI